MKSFMKLLTIILFFPVLLMTPVWLVNHYLGTEWAFMYLVCLVIGGSAYADTSEGKK